MTPPTSYQKQAQLLRTVAHPVRLRLLDILARQEACVCHMETLLGRPQPYVSKQLAVLRDAGLVTDRREGTLIYYRAADEGVGAWLKMGRALLQAANGDPAVDPPPAPEVVEGCPCPRCRRQYRVRSGGGGH